MKEYLTDAQVAEMLKISTLTLRRLLADGPPLTKPTSVDIRKAKPVLIGGQRRWNKSKLEGLLK